MTENVQSEATFEEETFTDEERIFSISEYSKKIWDLGLITYGGPMSHIGIFRKRLV